MNDQELADKILDVSNTQHHEIMCSKKERPDLVCGCEVAQIVNNAIELIKKK